MEENTTSAVDKESSLLASATKDELFVAQILLDLRSTGDIVQSLPVYKWARKKRRSCLDEGAPSSSGHVEIEQRKRKVKTAENGDGAAASPITPLLFSPSESDEKTKDALNRCSKKKSKEEYIVQIKELTACRDSLRTEVGKVKKYHDELEAYNRYLLAIKQEVQNSCHKKEASEVEISQHHLVKVKVAPHQQPLVADRAAKNYQPSFGPSAPQFSSSYHGLEPFNDVGPSQLPDLNISIEERFGLDPSRPLDALDDRRAKSAEARRVRRVIIKNKSMKSGNKLPGRR